MWALLCLALLLPEGAGPSSPVSAIEAAQRLHPAPDAEWSLIPQPFWKDHVVVKLVRTSQSAWIHRPTIAVDASGEAVVLTSGVIRVSDARLLEQFNEIARKERAAINTRNAGDYASFFLLAHLRSRDDDCITEPERTNERCPEPAFHLREDEAGFLVEAWLLDTSQGFRTFHRFRIHRDGTVDLAK